MPSIRRIPKRETAHQPVRTFEATIEDGVEPTPTVPSEVKDVDPVEAENKLSESVEPATAVKTVLSNASLNTPPGVSPIEVVESSDKLVGPIENASSPALVSSA